MTSPVAQLFGYPWPGTPPGYVGSLSVRLGTLAEAFGLRVQAYLANGLGPAVCVISQLPSGRGVMLEELERGVIHLDASGPDLWASAREVAADGAHAILTETLAPSHLGAARIANRPEGDSRQVAVEHAARSDQWRQRLARQ